MTIQFNIPDNIASRVVSGFARAHGYTDEIDNPETIQEFVAREGAANAGNYQRQIPNPVSAGNFCKAIIRSIIRQTVIDYEASQASRVAGDAARTTANSEINVS